MSLYDYKESQQVGDIGFYALIMAAMRKADDVNLVGLSLMWPEVYTELQERYNAPGGILSTDKQQARGTTRGTTFPPLLQNQQE